MQSRILELLKKKDGFVSGDLMSERVGITRQALWKHIQDFKEAGYEIEAVPHLGYRLVAVADRLYPVELTYRLGTSVFGSRVYHFDTTPSTMDAAVRLGMESAPEGTVVVAEGQSKGRGRLGREWHSPKHKGIYASMIMRPPVAPQAVSILTLLTGVSLCEAVSRTCGVQAQMKWPNDVMCGSRKVGGILTELNAEMDRVNFVVVGFGINVNNEVSSLPPHASSLKLEAGQKCCRIALLQEILRRQEENYAVWRKKGPAPIAELWRAHACTLGRRVKVHSSRRFIEGEALDITEYGALLIRTEAGLTETVTAGDVVHCR